MTGIADVVRSARSCWRPCVPFVLAFLSWIAQRVPGNIRALVLAWIVALSEDGLLCMPQPRLGFFQENEDACNPFLSDNNGRFTIESLPADEAHFWGLLLPVCCRATDGGEDCFLRLVALAESIEATSTLNDRAHLMIFFGIDQHDLFFDRDDTKLRITQIFMTIGIPNDAIHISILRSHYRGKLCRIWDFLAGKAVEEGCCFSLLVGDDVRFLTKDWKVEVEQQFSSIALRCKLPYGMACVALRDVTFSVFPTFPVIHRSHFAVFGCLFPVQFVNQHGDPFLFEVYRRLGASEFAKVASLENTIGGAGESRYSKQSVQWQGDVLSIAVSKLLHSSGLQQPVVCIDVIIPTFRCDLSYLNTLTQLGVSSDCCSVHFLVVVDNPGSDTARNLVILNDWSPNHLVRVKYNDCNIGASASRNVGIATSCGDWLVLLDDDVIPDSHLLDAYLGAILRHPNAKILVGLTSLPAPETLMQQALMASQMTFFYDVAKRMKNPPWGVTANLCIQGRTCDRVIWFNSNYPFSGGGEDVDFCLRIKGLLPIHARHEAVVAVPEARVNHPFWTNVTQQVVGWAFGDVLCLNYLPDQAFYAPPCWIEFIFIHSVVVVLWFKWSSWPQFAVMAMTVTALEVAMIACNSFSNTGAARLYWRRVVVAIVSALPVMAQDLVRLWSKLRRLRFSHLCMRLDWMDGRAEHVSATRFALTVKAVFFVVAAVLSVVDWRWWLIGAVVLSGLVLLWNQSLHFSPAREVQARLQQLQPLPVDFPPDGPQPFIVLASQRTDCHAQRGLQSSQDLDVPERRHSQRPKLEVGHLIFSRDANPLSFICSLFLHKSKKKTNARAAGFKLFPDHCNASNQHALAVALADVRVKKIILRRENYLEVYASKLRSDKTGDYITKPLDEIRVSIDLTAFNSFIGYYDDCYEHYEACVAGQTVHRITYEELVKDQSKAVKAVLGFLGVDSSSAPPALSVNVKQTLAPLADGVVNYAELCEAFALHPKAEMMFV